MTSSDTYNNKTTTSPPTINTITTTETQSFDLLDSLLHQLESDSRQSLIVSFLLCIDYDFFPF